MSGHRWGVDETGSLASGERSIVVAVSSHDGEFRRLAEKRRGSGYRRTMPYGDFHYIILDPEMLDVAKDVYQPTTRYGLSMNGKFPEFMLRTQAVCHLLHFSGFDPHVDTATIDAYCRSVVLREMVLAGLSRLRDEEIPKSSIRCENYADIRDPVVGAADDDAYRLVDNHALFPDRRINFSVSDIERGGPRMHLGIEHNRTPSYVNNGMGR